MVAGLSTGKAVQKLDSDGGTVVECCFRRVTRPQNSLPVEAEYGRLTGRMIHPVRSEEVGILHKG